MKIKIFIVLTFSLLAIAFMFSSCNYYEYINRTTAVTNEDETSETFLYVGDYSEPSEETTLPKITVRNETFTGNTGTGNALKNENINYTYIPTKDGYYKFACTKIGGAFVTVYDTNGKILASQLNEVVAALDIGKTYIITLSEFKEDGPYTLIVSQTSGSKVMTGNTSTGQIISSDQNVEYSYVAPKTGLYEISAVADGGAYVTVSEGIDNYIDSHQDKVAVNLTVGKTYTIKLNNFIKTGTYKIKILYPEGTLTAGKNNSGTVISSEQIISYSYKPESTGVYQITFGKLDKGAYVSVYDSNKKFIDSNQDVIIIELTKGKKYIIELTGFNSTGDYTLNIAPPPPPSSMSGNSASGKLISDGQIIEYYYTATKSGVHKVSCNVSGGAYITIYDKERKFLDSHQDSVGINLTSGQKIIISLGSFKSTGDYKVNVALPVPPSAMSGQSASGKVVSDNDIAEYYYTPAKNGVHEIKCSINGGAYITVYDMNRKFVDSHQDKLVINLKAAEKYIISIGSFKSTGTFNLSIQPPPEPKTMSGTSESGSVDVVERVPEFYYTAPLTGFYDITCSMSGGVYITVADSQGKYIDSHLNRVLINMTKGVKYKISLSDFKQAGTYKLSLKVPEATKTITGKTASGKLLDDNQIIEYYYVALAAGKYKFACTQGMPAYISVYDNNNTYIDSHLNEVEVTLKANTKYTIRMNDFTGAVNYTLTITAP